MVSGGVLFGTAAKIHIVYPAQIMLKAKNVETIFLSRLFNVYSTIVVTQQVYKCLAIICYLLSICYAQKEP